MPVTKISENEEFGPFINSAAGKLIVIDFYADWCGPCKAIAPYVEELSNTYAAKAVFAKVDIQACDQIASAYNVSGIPYFVFIREGRMVDSLTGAKKDVLKQKIEENINAMNSAGTGEGGSSTLYGIQKAMDLSSEVDKNASECLNEDDEHPWTNAVLDANNAGTCLKSDCDEQLLIRVVFTNKVKLYGIKMVGCASLNAPSPNKVRIFINQTNSLDFDKAENGVPTLDVDIAKDGCNENTDAILLPKLKFANVENITLFIPGNFAESDQTILRSLIFIGQTHSAKTNMAEFKRVAGKIGEGE